MTEHASPPSLPPTPTPPPVACRLPSRRAKLTTSQTIVVVVCAVFLLASPFTLTVLYGQGIADPATFGSGLSRLLCSGCAFAGLGALIGAATRRWSSWPGVIAFALPTLGLALFTSLFLISHHKHVQTSRAFDKLDADKARLLDDVIKQIDTEGSVTDPTKLTTQMLGSMNAASKQMSGEEAVAMQAIHQVLGRAAEKTNALVSAVTAFQAKGGLDAKTLQTAELRQERLAILKDMEIKREAVLQAALALPAEAEKAMLARGVSPALAAGAVKALRKDLESGTVQKVHRLMSEQNALLQESLGILGAYAGEWSVRSEGVMFTSKVPAATMQRFDDIAYRVKALEVEIGDTQRGMFEKLKQPK